MSRHSNSQQSSSSALCPSLGSGVFFCVSGCQSLGLTLIPPSRPRSNSRLLPESPLSASVDSTQFPVARPGAHPLQSLTLLRFSLNLWGVVSPAVHSAQTVEGIGDLQTRPSLSFQLYRHACCGIHVSCSTCLPPSPCLGAYNLLLGKPLILGPVSSVPP